MSEIAAKAAKIKLLILDVDGVLTNGVIYYGSQQIELKGFNVYDGLGIKLLQRTGIQIAIISAKTSEGTQRRLTDLNIEHIYLGASDKLPVYEALKQRLGLKDEEIA